MKFEDWNGNGYIDRGKNTVDDPGDRKIIGNEEPRYIYSFTLSGDWNNIWFKYIWCFLSTSFIIYITSRCIFNFRISNGTI